MNAAVVTFPGSNNDEDCYYTLSQICGWNTERLWHKDTPDLSGFDFVLLPGGFSYGDYLRCGAMASVSPIMKSIKRYAHSGKLLMGICNGFQILCESGLLPGALARNESLRFSCKDVVLNVVDNESPWTQCLNKGDTLTFPIAHGEGRYVIGESQYKELQENQQVLLTYQKNPNGSCYDIAGVCNREKNVFALMPHPERASDLRSEDGKMIWKSILRAVENAR